MDIDVKGQDSVSVGVPGLWWELGTRAGAGTLLNTGERGGLLSGVENQEQGGPRWQKG